MAITACAQLRPRPESVEKANRILAQIARRNATLNTFKALGKYKTATANLKLSGRLIWAGSQPNLLRIEALDPAGRPAATIAHDGTWLYLLDKNTGRFHKKKPSSFALAQYLPISIEPTEIYAFLSGRIPVRNHRVPTYDDTDSIDPGQGGVVTLANTWGSMVQKIHIDTQTGHIHHIDMFTAQGEPDYNVDIGPRRTLAGFDMPSYLVFHSPNTNTLRIDILRLWPNPSFDPSLFSPG